MTGGGETPPTPFISALLKGIDGVLGARDAVGAIIEPIYFLKRTWYSDCGLSVAATQPEGYAKDLVTQLLPSPGMKQFSQDVRLREGGAIKAGDIILKNVSKNLYDESNLDGSSSAANVENLFIIGQKVYTVINVTESYATWNIQVRQLTNQTRY